MKRFIHIYLLILTYLFSDVYALEYKPLVDLKSHLAISINPNCNSQYVNYAIITSNFHGCLSKFKTQMDL